MEKERGNARGIFGTFLVCIWDYGITELAKKRSAARKTSSNVRKAWFGRVVWGRAKGTGNFSSLIKGVFPSKDESNQKRAAKIENKKLISQAQG